MSPWLRRRLGLDRVLAAVLLVPVAPLIAALVLCVRIGDRGPGLLRVDRVGRAGDVFGMWKLRSMKAALPGGLAGGSDLTSGDDDRVTPVGRRLRQLRLDELPQLWNVVRGEMALIGPRPEAPAYVDVSDDRWARILRVPPGIAGASQVLLNRWEAATLRGEAESPTRYTEVVLPVKVAVDEWYVASTTAGLDWQIMRALLTGRRRTLKDRVSRAVPLVREMPDD